MNRTTQVPNAKGGWNIRGGGSRNCRHFATKKAAEAYGRQVSFNQKTVLVIHREVGNSAYCNVQD